MTSKNAALTLVEMTAAEIRETHFYDAEPIDDLPGIHCTALLAPFDDLTTETLDQDLYGWGCQRPSPSQTLWYSPTQLAIVVYSSHEIYLFTFDSRDAFDTHLAEIRSHLP
jgi:hypothetical protein